MSKANQRQVGGDHYKQTNGGEEHWDRVWRLGLDYFQAQITKYVERWKLKNGLQDLKKAQHVLEKYIELCTPIDEDEPKSKPVDLSSFEKAVSDLQQMESVRVIQLKQKCNANERIYRVGEIKPSGWVQFVFEGADHNGFLFTCKTCRNKFYAPADDNPHDHHPCRGLADSLLSFTIVTADPADPAEPTRNYVNQ